MSRLVLAGALLSCVVSGCASAGPAPPPPRAVAVAAPRPVQPSSPAPGTVRMMASLDAYRLCVFGRANELVKTATAPSDIADASLSECSGTFRDMERSNVLFFQNVTEGNISAARTRDDTRRTVIALVVRERELLAKKQDR